MTWPTLQIGDPARPPIIFLHGFMGSARDWLPAAERLADSYACILPDLPGHGPLPDPPPSTPLQFETLELDLAAFVEQVANDHPLSSRPVLAGYSLGGRLALLLACRRPGAIQALVLESASPGLPDLPSRRRRIELDHKRAAFIRESGLPAFLESWYSAPLWDSLHARPALLQEIIRQRSRNDPPWMAKLIADLSPGVMPDLWPCLPGLSMPVQLLAGGLDPKYPRLMRDMAARMPNAGLEVIENAGHNVHLEQLDAFIAVLSRFLGK